jgi:hypothetical protein
VNVISAACGSMQSWRSESSRGEIYPSILNLKPNRSTTTVPTNYVALTLFSTRVSRLRRVCTASIHSHKIKNWWLELLLSYGRLPYFYQASTHSLLD